MTKKKIFTLIVLIASIEIIFTYGQSTSQPNTNILESVLNKARIYCDRLDRIALYFTCTEEILETIYEPFRVPAFKSGWKKIENKYAFDYQLIKRNETTKIEDQRILVKKNGKKSSEEEKPVSLDRFSFGKVVYGPIGLFGYEAQIYNNYIIEKETAALWGRKVAIVKATPKNPEKEKWLYGLAWIDKETGSILKIEWEGASMGNYKIALDLAEKMDAEPIIQVISQYEYEKNGIRFPSFFNIKEDYLQRSPVWGTGARKINKSELIVTYRDYKYFTVETSVKY